MDPSEIARKLVELKVEHRDLDTVIDRLSVDRGTDELQLKRLKKRKLAIKDMIAWLESKLIPDLDAREAVKKQPLGRAMHARA